MSANRVEVYGYKGAIAVYPENTMNGFELALSTGADGFKCDVNVTKDNVVVVCHDQILKAPIYKGPAESAVVRELTLEQLNKWDCGGTVSEWIRQKALPGARIPTLDEVFALAVKGNFRFLVEAKSSPQYPERTAPPDQLAQMILDKIKAHRLERRVDFISTHYRVLREMKKIAPEIIIAVPYTSESKMMDVISKTNANIISPAFMKVSAEEVRAAHAIGVKVTPLGNEKAEWESHIAAGVDGIVCADPAALISFLKSKGLR